MIEITKIHNKDENTYIKFNGSNIYIKYSGCPGCGLNEWDSFLGFEDKRIGSLIVDSHLDNIANQIRHRKDKYNEEENDRYRQILSVFRLAQLSEGQLNLTLQSINQNNITLGVLNSLDNYLTLSSGYIERGFDKLAHCNDRLVLSLYAIKKLYDPKIKFEFLGKTY